MTERHKNAVTKKPVLTIAPTVADVKHEYLDSLKKDNARVRAHVAAEDAKANALKV